MLFNVPYLKGFLVFLPKLCGRWIALPLSLFTSIIHRRRSPFSFYSFYTESIFRYLSYFTSLDPVNGIRSVHSPSHIPIFLSWNIQPFLRSRVRAFPLSIDLYLYKVHQSSLFLFFNSNNRFTTDLLRTKQFSKHKVSELPFLTEASEAHLTS